ncbi:hypothetical protein [Nonomuraea sp. NPDC005650]|uniref:hypothetical protein n=1 Tax=Nonomuraea sp. NPDC005650 TaxID=3157045 RepID=UPI0033BF022C
MDTPIYDQLAAELANRTVATAAATTTPTPPALPKRTPARAARPETRDWFTPAAQGAAA